MRYKVKVLVNQLHIRTGPSVSYKEIGHRNKGDTFICTKIKKLASGETWYKEENKKKWSCAKLKSGKKYIKIVSDLEMKSTIKPSITVTSELKGGNGVVNPFVAELEKFIEKTKTDGDIKDMSGNGVNAGIPRESNSTRLSRMTVMSGAAGSKSDLDSDITNGYHNPGGFYVYNSANFPKIKVNTIKGRAEDAVRSIPNATKSTIDEFMKKHDARYWMLSHITSNGSAVMINTAKANVDMDFQMPLVDDPAFKTKLEAIRRNVNTSVGIDRPALNHHTHLQFNRFRIQYPDVLLKNSVGVIFFTRPDLNILYGSEVGKEARGNVHSQVKSDIRDYYLILQNPALAGLLTESGGNIKALRNHNFNPLLSNLAQGIEVIDDNINLLEYGETFTGYKMNYAKHSTGSVTAGTLNIKFKETYDLAVTNMHQIWVDYESNVYKGIYKPKDSHIWAKELDYACNIYYFLLDIDMETILFWSKYYGCFPSNVPKSTFSYDYGSNVQFPDVQVTYNYIYRTDLNPQTLVEFNLDGAVRKLACQYYPNYPESGNDTSTYTWAGVPYVATYRDNTNSRLMNDMAVTNLQKSDKLRLRYRKQGVY